MQQLDRNAAIEFLGRQEVVHFGVVDDEGPYVSPLSFVVIGSTVYFRTRPGRRLTALSEDPRVCLEASEVGATSWTSVCAWGDAAVVADSNTEADVVAALIAKYADGSLLSYARGSVLGSEAVVVAVPIDEVTGVASGDALGAHVRPGRL